MKLVNPSPEENEEGFVGNEADTFWRTCFGIRDNNTKMRNFCCRFRYGSLSSSHQNPGKGQTKMNSQDSWYGGPLHLACYQGDLGKVEDLLLAGADPNGNYSHHLQKQIHITNKCV